METKPNGSWAGALAIVFVTYVVLPLVGLALYIGLPVLVIMALLKFVFG